MPGRINIPNVLGQNLAGIPPGVILFIQSSQDAFAYLDRNVVYKDTIKLGRLNSWIRSKNATGVTYTNSDGIVYASGRDYAQLVSDVQSIISGYNELVNFCNDLVNQLKGQ